MTRRLVSTTALAMALCLSWFATTVRGDGLPIPYDGIGGGVTVAGSPIRFATVSTPRGTELVRIRVDGGEVTGTWHLRGEFAVPGVALDASQSGLSADGSTLVLINPRVRFPRTRTTLMVLDTARLWQQPRRLIRLRGDFSFDAISPDGGLIYLVEYTSRRDPREYLVRAFDLDAGRLLEEEIVDPDEPAEEMGGFPLTRAVSPDGRWAYTLYDGVEHPFIHALDTEGRTAACIDLDMFDWTRFSGVEPGLRLDVSPGGERLTVIRHGKPLALVDTGTFEVSEPAADDSAEGGGGLPWQAAPVGAVLVLLAAGLAIRRRRSRGAISADELESLLAGEAGRPEREAEYAAPRAGRP